MVLPCAQGMPPGFLSRALPPGTLTVHMMGLGQIGSAGSGAGMLRLEGASCSMGLAGTGGAVHADGSSSRGVGSMGSAVHSSTALQAGPLARQGSTGLPGMGGGMHASSTLQARHLAPQGSRGLPGMGGGGTVHASSAPQPGVMALQGSVGFLWQGAQASKQAHVSLTHGRLCSPPTTAPRSAVQALHSLNRFQLPALYMQAGLRVAWVSLCRLP